MAPLPIKGLANLDESILSSNEACWWCLNNESCLRVIMPMHSQTLLVLVLGTIHGHLRVKS